MAPLDSRQLLDRQSVSPIEERDPIEAGLGIPPHDARLMCDALTKSVARARDNEVYVIVANLFNRDPYVAHLESAIKMAVARHHRVVILGTRPYPVLPIPPGMREWAKGVIDEPATKERRILLRAEALKIDERLVNLKRQLRKAGAKVAVASTERNAISLVLAEAELAGRGRTLTGARV